MLLADLELHGNDRHARLRNRIDMIHPGDLRQHLLGRCGHGLRHISGGGARIGNQHIRHGYIDLRLFLARRHQHCKRTQQHCNQCQQWRHVRVQKILGDTS